MKWLKKRNLLTINPDRLKKSDLRIHKIKSD